MNEETAKLIELKGKVEAVIKYIETAYEERKYMSDEVRVIYAILAGKSYEIKEEKEEQHDTL